MTTLRVALGVAACVVLPAVVAAALAGYAYERVVAREAELFDGIEDEIDWRAAIGSDA